MGMLEQGTSRLGELSCVRLWFVWFADFDRGTAERVLEIVQKAQVLGSKL